MPDGKTTRLLYMSALAVASPDRASTATSVSRSEIISALSFALDLTEGAVTGHALRSCLLGMRIADHVPVPIQQRRSLYYGLLLKDVGCSSNAARMCQIIGGDDRALKAGVKLEDWTRPHRPSMSSLGLLWKLVMPEANAFRKFPRIGHIARMQHRNNEQMIKLRCDRGASILNKLGMGADAADTVLYLDEHWDGSGYPERRRKHDIPLLARIAAVSQHLDVFATERGPELAVTALQQRSGRWFDPELVAIATSLHAEGLLWSGAEQSVDVEETRRRVLAMAPEEERPLAASEVDLICEAFAEVVDAKSPFTYHHSIGVANAANAIAKHMDLADARLQLVGRASLLHDIGKLSVPNTILDKPGKLTAPEWKVLEQHPGLTRQILSRVSAFQNLAVIAGEHHEKLDGTGYPEGLRAQDLCLESRIVAVADVYGALAEDRPYRKALALEEVVSIMQGMAPHQLDPECVEALVQVTARDGGLSCYSPGVCAQTTEFLFGCDGLALA